MRKAADKKGSGKETLRANIKTYIKRMIAEGVYKPGDRIVETRLARELDVSQAPVREAMLELSTMGLLEERPYSGTYVRRMTSLDIEDIFEIRAFLEEYGAKQAAKLVTAEQLDAMEQVLLQMDETASDISRFVDSDTKFHELVMDAAGSPALKRAWTILRMSEWTYICAIVTESTLSEMIAQHWKIFHYLQQHDEASVGAFMFLHIKGFGAELARHFKEQDETPPAAPL